MVQRGCPRCKAAARLPQRGGAVICPRCAMRGSRSPAPDPCGSQGPAVRLCDTYFNTLAHLRDGVCFPTHIGPITADGDWTPDDDANDGDEIVEQRDFEVQLDPDVFVSQLQIQFSRGRVRVGVVERRP